MGSRIIHFDFDKRCLKYKLISYIHSRLLINYSVYNKLVSKLTNCQRLDDWILLKENIFTLTNSSFDFLTFFAPFFLPPDLDQGKQKDTEMWIRIDVIALT